MPRRKSEESEKPKLNPYKEFTNWLFDGNKENIIDDKILAAISPKTILERFGNVGNITIFLDEYFNNYNLFTINKRLFFDMLKDIVIKKNINQRQFTWWSNSKRDDLIDTISRKFPTLKKHEIVSMLTLISEDDIKQLYETCGLANYKEEKIKVEKRKNVK